MRRRPGLIWLLIGVFSFTSLGIPLPAFAATGTNSRSVTTGPILPPSTAAISTLSTSKPPKPVPVIKPSVSKTPTPDFSAKLPSFTPNHPLQSKPKKVTLPDGKGHPTLSLKAPNKTTPFVGLDGTGATGSPTTILHYQGGPVLHNPTLYVIFAGPTWNNVTATSNMKSSVETTFSNLASAAGTSYQTILSQYSDTTGYPHADLSVAYWVDTSPVAGTSGTPWDSYGESTPTWGTEHDEIVAAETANSWTNNSDSYWMIFPEPNSVYSNPTATGNHWCAFHSFTTTGNLYFAIDPYESDTDFVNQGCVANSSDTTALTNGMTNIASHEYMEGVTDPAGNAWYNYDTPKYEVGDMCSSQAANMPGTTGIPGITNQLQSIWDNNGGNSLVTDPYCAAYSFPFWDTGTPSVTASSNSVSVTVPTLHTVIPATVVATAFSGITAENRVVGNTGADSTFTQTPTITVNGLPAGSAFTFKAYATNMYGQTTWTPASNSATPGGTATTYQSVVESNSPSAYYTFDDNPYVFNNTPYPSSVVPDLRSIVTDSSANGNDTNALMDSAYVGEVSGTIGPNLAGATPNIGRSFAFAFSGITVSSDTNLPSGNSPRTIEGWFLSPSSNTYQDIVFYGTKTTGEAFGIRIHDQNGIEVHTYGGPLWDFSNASTIGNGGWHYFAVTYAPTSSTTGGPLSAYEDGQLVGTEDFGPINTVTTGQTLSFATGDGGTLQNSTGLDDMAIYPSALSTSLISTHWQQAMGANCTVPTNTIYSSAVLANSPLAYYRLDDPPTSPSGSPILSISSLVAKDISGNCHNAAYSTGYQSDVLGATGDGDHATSINNGPQVAYQTGDWMPSGNSPFTIEGWLRPTPGQPNQALINYGYLDGLGHSMRISPYSGGHSGIEVSGVGANTVDFNTDTLANPLNPIDGGWHYIVVTYDGTNLTVYLDDFWVGSVAYTANVWFGPTGPAYGNTPYSNYSTTSVTGIRLGSDMKGPIDDLAIYGSALNKSAIDAHWIAAGQLPGGDYTGSQTLAGGNPAKASGSPCNPQAGGPINTASGNLTDTFTDIHIPGRTCPLEITRTYNAQAAITNGPFGYGWTGNYVMGLAVIGTPNTNGAYAVITQENGSTVTFAYTTSGYTAPPRVIGTLSYSSGTWTFVRQGYKTFIFNSSGQITSTTDTNGYTTTYSYTSGNLSTVTDSAGRSLALTWTGSHITAVTDANVSPSRTVSYTYDSSGNLTDVIDILGGHTQFTYDSSHLMTVMKDPVCYANTCPGEQNTFDSSNRVILQKDQLNRALTFDYTSIAGATKITDPKGNVRVDYFSHGLRTKTTAGYGSSVASTTLFSYDPYTLALTSATDPNGHTTTMTVDSKGNILTVTDPLSRVTTNTYNSFNEILTSQDPSGITTTYTYDSHGNLGSVSRPLSGTGYTQTTTYNHSNSTFPGDVTSMVDPDSKTTTYTYDSNGYQASSTDPLSHKSTAVYNADGFMTSSVTPLGNVSGCSCASQYTTTMTYNKAGQALTITDPLSQVTTNTYDANGNLLTVKDPNTNITTYVYDLANELTQTTRSDSTHTNTDYNLDGTVLDQKDGKGNAILIYAYDAQGRVVSTTDALAHTTSYTYDTNGNLLSKQDPGGNCSASPKTGCTTYTYDNDNELKTVTYSDGTTSNISSVTYNSLGQRTAMTDGTGSSSWTWDSLGRLTAFSNGHGDSLSYAYNLRNLQTSITYPGSATVTKAYDDAGKWVSLTDMNSKTTNFSYDANSNLTTETLPSSTGVVDSFTYNKADHLTAISDVHGGTTLFSASYTRDSNSQLSSDNSATTHQTNFKYNSLNQVCYAGHNLTNACSSPPSQSQPFSYDAADNLTQMGSTYQAFNNADQLCWTYTSSAACGSPPTGSTSYSYDTRGNRTANGTTTLTYDQSNRLTGYGSSATYTYNGDGLRESKTVSGTTTQELWDPSQGLPQLVKDGSTEYIYGPLGVLEQIGSATLYYHQDQIGSTRLVTDSSGASAATYTFDPYGNLVASTGSITNPFLYTGQYKDAESGFYYLRARYYDPVTGQFLTCDPLVALTLSPYGYVTGMPLNAADLTGLACAITSPQQCNWGAGGSAGYNSIVGQNWTPKAQDMANSAHEVAMVCGMATIAAAITVAGSPLALATETCAATASAMAFGADAWMASHGDCGASWSNAGWDALGAIPGFGGVGSEIKGARYADAAIQAGKGRQGMSALARSLRSQRNLYNGISENLQSLTYISTVKDWASAAQNWMESN